jgi:hypothetical protein
MKMDQEFQSIPASVIKQTAALEPGGFVEVEAQDSAGNRIAVRLTVADGELVIETWPAYFGGQIDTRRDRITLSYTPCHLGGKRAWWRCPGCGDRYAFLFEQGRRWRCRNCFGLSYRSSRVSRVKRLEIKIRALREQLVDTGGGIFAQWGRPKGMRQRRYIRITRDLEKARDQHIRLISRAFMRSIKS